jgi:NAD(P)-dependent dehydrogenase (short-subunit alcohol dehydrogenase family)
MPVDISNLASVRDFASSLSAFINSGSLPRVRALICAAAVMQVGGKRATDDGMEATFQVNYLANFLLVLLLLPMMRRDCRVIFLTSNLILDEGVPHGSKVAEFNEYVNMLPDPVVEEMGRGKAFAEGTARYAISKVLLSMFAAELQRRLDTSNDFRGISVVLLDPGTFISGMINGRS